METNRIIQGDALSVLKTLPDESINCVMTSPPYWALRDYGSSVESIWDGKEGCEHYFEIKERQIHSGKVGVNGTIQACVDKEGGFKTDWKTKDGFCSKCGAWKGQLGLEPTFDLYIKHLCDIFDEVKRVLRKDGTCWVNLGDSYSNSGKGGYSENMYAQRHTEFGKISDIRRHGKPTRVKDLPPKSLCNIPARFSIEMQNRGWILRNVIIWHKPNCMPSSVKDRFTVDFEYLYFFVKNKKYWFETQYEPHKTPYEKLVKDKRGKNTRDTQKGEYVLAYRHGGEKTLGETMNPRGRNKRAVWTITTKPFKEAHFATYPEELCETPIKAGCPIGGIVIDPFLGSGTTAVACIKLNRNFIGIELNPEYIKIAEKRLKPYLEQQKLSQSSQFAGGVVQSPS